MPKTKNPNTKSAKAKIGQYLIIAFGWTWLIGLVLHLLHVKLNSLVGIGVLSILYMPAPFVAALITEKRLVTERFRIPKGHTSGATTFFFAPVISLAGFMALYFAAVYLLGNQLHIAAFGSLATSQQGLMKGAVQLLGQTAVNQAGAPPPPLVLILAGMWSAIIAGWTINGLFAMGEEYGWRGFLWDQLKQYGVVRANIAIGLIWGVWHAPLILQGYNYPGHPISGIAMMVLFTIGFSFVLTGIRELTGSLLPSAAAHGMLNALATLGLIFLINGNPLIAGPIGVTGSILFAFIGLGIWKRVALKNAPANKTLKKSPILGYVK